MSEDLIARARAFCAAIQANAPWETISAFYAPEIIQEELPNRLLPKGVVRDLAALAEANAKGRHVISSQTYDVTHAFADGAVVVLEASWSGTLAIDIGTLKAGDVMRARFAQVFEFQNGLIVRQRNYDCFEAF